MELAKTAMGWAELSAEQQMDSTRELLRRAQEFKEAL